MRIERGFAIVLALLLMLAAAMPAAAQQGQRVQLYGTIVAVDARQQAFLLREHRERNADRLWVIHVRGDMRVRVIQKERIDDDVRGYAPGPALGMLRLGSTVSVWGHFIGANRIMATEIRLMGQPQPVAQQPFFYVAPPPVMPPIPYYGQPPPNYGYPGYPQPGFPQQTQILYPQNGAVINTPEFTVIGRSFPFAQIHVEVSTVFAFFTFGAGSADVTADGNGFFAATVRPSVRLPGATYRITVSSQVSGYPMQPTSITVTQQ